MLITDEGTKCLKCLDICKAGAIDIPAGEEYPVIDDYMCNDCGACAEICPVYAIMRDQ